MGWVVGLLAKHLSLSPRQLSSIWHWSKLTENSLKDHSTDFRAEDVSALHSGTTENAYSFKGSNKTSNIFLCVGILLLIGNCWFSVT